MPSKDQFSLRFKELAEVAGALPRHPEFPEHLDITAWAKWRANALTLLELTFGTTSPAFKSIYGLVDPTIRRSAAQSGIGAFLAAKEDFELGFANSLERTISGEIVGDFVLLAKNALAEGHKDVAAVLACAALEDALKRYASLNGLKVDGKTMDTVVGALKAAGLVQGAQKSLLDAMPRVRNCAMHADWAKITEPDVNSVIGFVESFLQTKF